MRRQAWPRNFKTEGHACRRIGKTEGAAPVSATPSREAVLLVVLVES